MAPVTELTLQEKQVFEHIERDTKDYMRVRAQIRKKRLHEQSHQSSLEEWF
jgi:FPC/CPF motif-containing protein YcgG